MAIEEEIEAGLQRLVALARSELVADPPPPDELRVPLERLVAWADGHETLSADELIELQDETISAANRVTQRTEAEIAMLKVRPPDQSNRPA